MMTTQRAVLSSMGQCLRLSLAIVAMCCACLSAAARDTTPFQCEQFTVARTRSWAAPILRDYCEKQEASSGQAFAKIQGKPRPSTAVYSLPAYGSSEAKKTGLACIAGTAMQRLPNGWQQLRDREQNWLRCQDL